VGLFPYFRDFELAFGILFIRLFLKVKKKKKKKKEKKILG